MMWGHRHRNFLVWHCARGQDVSRVAVGWNVLAPMTTPGGARRSCLVVLILVALVACVFQSAAAGADEVSVRERLAAMTPAEREEFERKQRRFYELPEAEQERLRQLHTEITTAPDAAQLVQAMQRYHEWLKTLRPGERAELRSLPLDQRIQRIKQLRDNQALQRFRQMTASTLDADDLRHIGEWARDYLRRHESEIVATMPPEQQQAYRESKDVRYKGFLLTMAFLRLEANRLNISQEEVNDLLARLSPDAQKLLPRETDAQQRNRMLRTWIEVALWSPWRRDHPQPEVSQDELARFLEKEVSPEQREYLEGLPAELFRREAERLYHFYKRRGEGFPPRGRGRSGSEPPQSPPGPPLRVPPSK